MWVFPKIMVPPNHPLKNRVWNHYFHHPFWGVSIPLFLVQHPYEEDFPFVALGCHPGQQCIKSFSLGLVVHGDPTTAICDRVESINSHDISIYPP